MTPEQTREFVGYCKHPAITGKRGLDLHLGDLCFDIEENEIVVLSCAYEINDAEQYRPENFIWLPPVYDYQNPERGLEGMLTGPIVLWSDDDKTSYTVRVFAEGASPSTEEFSGPLPIALAKAVIWQHEQEEK